MAPSILLIKLGHLGDTLLLTPTIRAVREAHPAARIDVMVRRGCEVMLQGNPDVSHLLSSGRPESDRRSVRDTVIETVHSLRHVALQRYDFAFDLSDSDRSKLWILLSASRIRAHNDRGIESSWKHRLFNAVSHFDWVREHQVLRDFNTVSEVMGLRSEPGPLRFAAPPASDRLHQLLPGLAGTEGYAVIHPASRWAFKEWLPERWATLVRHLRTELGLRVVISSGPSRRELSLKDDIIHRAACPVDATAGRLSLPELARVLAGARLFVGIDTVTMHLAAAMQTPTVALFGRSSEWSWHPWKVRHELILGPCTCKHARAFVCDKTKPFPCMTGITVDSVMGGVRGLLASE